MSRRRQKTPWIHLRSRYIIGAIATVGALGTAYLTIVKVMGGDAACPAQGCEQVLSSPYATVFGLPLTLFGFLGYFSMGVLSLGPLAVKPENNKDLRLKLDQWSWLLLFAGATAMTVFSGYLMYLLAAEIRTTCIYCITSAILSVSMFALTLMGRAWDDRGQLLFTGFLVAVVTLVGTLGVYSGVDNPSSPVTASSGSATGQAPPPIQTTSGEAEMALAQHLSDIGAKKYSAYWCPHCHAQQAMFGREAFALIDYIECDPQGQNAQPELCQAAGVEGYPSWEINGEIYSGTIPLEDLAALSGYDGPMNFKN
ncbi:MAG: vitamin K epoxide reductase family protein [Elainellaceae cyanobacterium]